MEEVTELTIKMLHIEKQFLGLEDNLNIFKAFLK